MTHTAAMSLSQDSSEAGAAAAAARTHPEPVRLPGDRSMTALVGEFPGWPVWNGSSLKINDFISRIMQHIQPILGKYNSKLIARVILAQCVDAETRRCLRGFPSLSALLLDLNELSKDPDRILWSLERLVCDWEPVTHSDPASIKKFQCQMVKLERYCRDMGYQQLLYTDIMLGLISGLIGVVMVEGFQVYMQDKVGQEAPGQVFKFVGSYELVSAWRTAPVGPPPPPRIPASTLGRKKDITRKDRSNC